MPRVITPRMSIPHTKLPQKPASTHDDPLNYIAWIPVIFLGGFLLVHGVSRRHAELIHTHKELTRVMEGIRTELRYKR
ncbi:hypothetical protein LTR56_010505 [Elasticomyces elasticus]|nr:hypothetical protein LTR56_010505 [Elasticomyces elasticus]KAK3657921.1 hypothetical protein LTR22_009148 [Elasticomyces elasticus]KAK4917608.1 hypothetical protein LTR49_014562 [Elasticomyces elasticus]KAK5762828.1 hypothetical protein LTS12_007017 [Elasticomyces elasticus]